MDKPEHREGLVKTITQWCGATKTSMTSKTSGRLKRTSDATPCRGKETQEANRHRKISCPESAITPQMTSATASLTKYDGGRKVPSRSSSKVTEDGPGDTASTTANAPLTAAVLNKCSAAARLETASRSSSLRFSRRDDLDPDQVDQSATSTTPAASRRRKLGVSFKATQIVAAPSPPGSSHAVSVDWTPPGVITTLAPPSGGRKKLPNGRCRRYSDVMEYRQQVRFRRASCGAEAYPPMLSSSAMSPLNCTGLPVSDASVTPGHGDVTPERNDVTPSSNSPRRRLSSLSGLRSPNPPCRLEEHRDIRTPTSLSNNTRRVRQLLRKLDSAPVPVLSSRSRRITLQRTRNCDLSYAADRGSDFGGGGGGASGGGGSRGDGTRSRSQSLSAMDSPRRRRGGGGIVCANRDIIRLQDNFGVTPTSSGKAEIRDGGASGRKNVKCERSAIGGSVVPWQGDDMVVNVNALGKAMEVYLSGSLSS